MKSKARRLRAKWFAGGRVTVGTIDQLIAGNFRTFYVGKLRGLIVSLEVRYRWSTPEQARRCAEKFKTFCTAAE